MSHHRGQHVSITKSDQVLPFLKNMNPLDIASVIENHITVLHQPKGSATIKTNTGPTWSFSIRTDEDGFITTKGGTVLPGATILPNPALVGTQTPEGTLGLRATIRWAITERIIALLCDQYGFQQDQVMRWPVMAALTQWTRKMPKATAARIRGLGRYVEMENAVRRILDPVTWATARNANGKVHPKRYNRAVASATAIRELANTNPGATSWLISQDRTPSEKLHHPGQVIQKVQERAQRAGVEPRYWKTISKMEAASMELLMDHHIPQYGAAIIINACGDVQCSPTVRQASNAAAIFSVCRGRATHIAAPHKNEPPIATRGRQRLRYILGLALKPSGPQQNLTDQWATLIHLADYAANLIDNDNDVTARTYNGMLKAARRWHQFEQQAEAAAQIQEQIDKDNGWFPAWNSLIETTTTPDPYNPDMPPITAVPLCNTPDLLEEGKKMRHCVGTYGNSCARGNSRIFSIRQGDNTLATTELVLKNTRWQTAQTRGYMNRDPGPSATQTAKFLAAAYQEHWHMDSNTEQRHQAWLERPGTEDKKPYRRHQAG